MKAAFLYADSSLSVFVKDLQWNTQRHTVTVKDSIVTLTVIEYRLLFPLRHGVPTNYSDLAYIVYTSAADEKVSKMIDDHLNHICGKLQGTGIFLYRVPLWHEQTGPFYS